LVVCFIGRLHSARYITTDHLWMNTKPLRGLQFIYVGQTNPSEPVTFFKLVAQSGMNWIPFLILAAVVVVVLMLKKLGQISATEALSYLKNGALVIDVRSPGEFNSGHLARAINVPLDEIETAGPKRVEDKNQVLLLYCASGMRSGVAKGKLKSLGYTNAFNLGSYGRAESILNQALEPVKQTR
jgi:phage shock protein E